MLSLLQGEGLQKRCCQPGPASQQMLTREKNTGWKPKGTQGNLQDASACIQQHQSPAPRKLLGLLVAASHLQTA